MCRLIVTAGLCLIIASLASSASLTNPGPNTATGGFTGGFCKGKWNGNYVNPSNLNTFYSCSNGLTYIMKCPAGLIFRQRCNCCDWPTSIIPSTTTTTTAKPRTTWDFCKGRNDGIYANPNNLNSFFSCSHGSTYVQYCPADLIFKDSCKCCDWPTTKPSGSRGDFCNRKRDGNYVNPSNLNTFYSCSNGLTYIMDCPAGLIFRQSCNCCNWR